jgi:hypothetical protein
VPNLPKVFASAAIFAALCVSRVFAGPLDPLGPDFPDIGVDGLYLSVKSPVCFTVGGDNDCLQNLTITASGIVNDSYSGGNEHTTFSGVLSGNLVDTTTNQNLGLFSLPSLSNVDLELQSRASGADGTFSSFFNVFSFSGNLPGLGAAVINQDGAPDMTGSTTINGPNPGGSFSVTSYFDIFTELSLNNGATFIPSSQSQSEFDLAQSPEPGSALMCLLGVTSLIAMVRRHKRKPDGY